MHQSLSSSCTSSFLIWHPSPVHKYVHMTPGDLGDQDTPPWLGDTERTVNMAHSTAGTASLIRGTAAAAHHQSSSGTPCRDLITYTYTYRTRAWTEPREPGIPGHTTLACFDTAELAQPHSQPHQSFNSSCTSSILMCCPPSRLNHGYVTPVHLKYHTCAWHEHTTLAWVHKAHS